MGAVLSLKERAVGVDVSTHPHLATVVKQWDLHILGTSAGALGVVYLDYWRFNPVEQLRHIRVRTFSDCPTLRWSELQEVKNQVTGEKVRMVELYPSQRSVIDNSDTHHLWELPSDISLPDLSKLYPYNTVEE